MVTCLISYHNPEGRSISGKSFDRWGRPPTAIARGILFRGTASFCLDLLLAELPEEPGQCLQSGRDPFPLGVGKLFAVAGRAGSRRRPYLGTGQEPGRGRAGGGRKLIHP